MVHPRGELVRVFLRFWVIICGFFMWPQSLADSVCGTGPYLPVAGKVRYLPWYRYQHELCPRVTTALWYDRGGVCRAYALTRAAPLCIWARALIVPQVITKMRDQAQVA